MTTEIKMSGHDSYLPWRQVDFYEALAEAQSSLGEGVIIVEGHSRKLIYVNEAFCKMFGYSKQELLDLESIYDLVAPEEKEKLAARGALRMAGQGVVVADHYEAVGIRKDGSRIYTENSVKSIEGSENLALCLTRDISERKKREGAFNEAHQVINDLFNRAPCGYHSAGPDGTILYINDTLLSWLGYAREELVKKKTIFDIVAPSSLEIIKKNFFGFTKNCKSYDIETQMLKKNGELIPVLVKASAVVDADGKFIMSRTMTLDLTELTRVNQTRILSSIDRLQKSIDKLRRDHEMPS